MQVGHGCWIGDNVTVLPGAVIGPGAVVGAGSVVRGVVEPYGIVAGVPVRPIGSRCTREVAAALERSLWWTWTPEEMRRRSECFGLDISSARPVDVEDTIGEGFPSVGQPTDIEPQAP